jgi:hypothetical protein
MEDNNSYLKGLPSQCLGLEVGLTGVDHLLSATYKEITLIELIRTKYKPFVSNIALLTSLKLVTAHFLPHESKSNVEVNQEEGDELAPPRIDHLASAETNIRLSFEAPKFRLGAARLGGVGGNDPSLISLSGESRPVSPRKRGSIANQNSVAIPS